MPPGMAPAGNNHPPMAPSPTCAGTALGEPLPPLPGAQVRQAGLSSRQVKPKPPSKPLPALKGKAPSHGQGPSLPPAPFQPCPPPKVALKPPPARR